MAEHKIKLEKKHIMIAADAIKISPALKDLLYKNANIELELEGSYVNVYANNIMIYRLGENEWMPLHQA